MSELDAYIAAWSQACADVSAIIDELTADQWAAPSDCPGWSVQDVVAHLAALETELATGRRPRDVPDVSGKTVSSAWTEAGVAERRENTPEQLIAEFRDAAASRRQTLAADPPTNPAAIPEPRPGNVPWDNATLLRNRVLDVWVHEQDIRRAIGLPGGMDSPAAQITAATFAAALPFALARKTGAAPGTRVAVVVDGIPADLVLDEDGRARPVDPAAGGAPDTTITMNRETLTILGAGRRTPDNLPPTARLEITGDRDLAARFLAAMAVTP
ncbi:MAG: maleylpyruvate isomerase family mycothiol-dependent enzyme [Tetrasphaera sp.]